MEVKVGNAVPEWLIEKLSELGIYKISFSKYGRAYENFIKAGITESYSNQANIQLKNNILLNRSV